jgi:hypothetical protein
MTDKKMPPIGDTYKTNSNTNNPNPKCQFKNELKQVFYGMAAETLDLKRWPIFMKNISTIGYEARTLRVEALSDGTFIPDEDGKEMIILPDYYNGELVDLIAFDINTPYQWYLYYMNSVVANQDHIDEMAYFENPAKLYLTPLSWFLNGCKGSVVVNWQGHLPLYFASIQKIECETEGLKQKLKQTLTVQQRIPNMTLMNREGGNE